MTTAVEIDGADRPTVRDAVFEALDDADDGETLQLEVEREVHTALSQYQIERGVALEWDVGAAAPGEDDWGANAPVTVTKGGSLASDVVPDFDVRNLPPTQRHEVLTETFDRLGVDDGFVLVNDHDPKPLYYELASTHGPVVDFEYHSREADEWRVEISKTGESTAGSDEGVTATFDVREIPKPDRHPTIHHRYGNLEDGETIAIVAPHEPRPLQQEFRAQYGDGFEWRVREQEPGRCVVHVTKQLDDGDSEAGRDAAGSSELRDELEVVDELDVRTLPPADRHELIFASYENLDAGEGFVLVNDHDPKPLYHQFEAEAGPAFRWEYQLEDPGEFRVLIGKAATASEDEVNAELGASVAHSCGHGGDGEADDRAPF